MPELGPALEVTARPPWLGSTWTATATGLPANAIALTVYGFAPLSPSLALSTVFAQAGPGCDLLITPDIVEASLAVAGVARSSVTWPDTPALIGAQLYEQMVPCELGGAGALLDVTTTNAIVVTLGVFE